MRNEFLSSAMGELPPAECQAELWLLRDEDAARAEAILRGPAPAQPPWTCPGCGERLEGQFGQCWNCGAAKPA